MPCMCMHIDLVSTYMSCSIGMRNTWKNDIWYPQGASTSSISGGVGSGNSTKGLLTRNHDRSMPPSSSRTVIILFDHWWACFRDGSPGVVVLAQMVQHRDELTDWLPVDQILRHCHIRYHCGPGQSITCNVLHVRSNSGQEPPPWSSVENWARLATPYWTY